jgi:hypothetical protein
MPGRSTNEPSNYSAVGKQAAKDTEAATFTFLRHLDGTGFDLAEEVESVREGGDGQEVGLRYKTAVTADGAQVANARPEIAARLLAYALGADTVGPPAGVGTSASGVANEHLLTPTSLLPYLTIEQFWADKVERAPNTQVTNLDVEFEAGRPFKLTVQEVCGGSQYARAVASALTPTRETGAPFMYPGASVTLLGVAGAKMTKGKISIARNLDTGIRTTGLNREDVVGLTFDVSVEGTLKYESATTLYDIQNFGGAGGTQIPFDLATGALVIAQNNGSGTNARYLEIGVNAFHITDARVNKLSPDGAVMYVDFSAQGYRSATNQLYAKVSIASTAALV